MMELSPVWIVCFICLLTYLIYILVPKYREFRVWQSVYDAFPGLPNKHWLWGHVHLYPGPNEKGLAYQREQTGRFPKFRRIWVGQFRAVLVCTHPDTVKLILKTAEPKPRAIGTVYILGIHWLGEGLLIANGNRWARNRRLLTPAFHFDILQPYIKVYNQAVDILLNKVDGIAARGESFELFSHIGLCSLDILLRCVFSHQSDCQIQGDTHPYVQAVHTMTELWVERALKPWLYPDIIYFLTSKGRQFSKSSNYVHSVAEDIITKRKEAILMDGPPTKRYLDFLDILLTAKDENGEGLNSLEVRNEVDTFLFEGHDTTTSAICWILFSLAKHPEHQRRVQAEVDKLLGDRYPRCLEWHHLQKLEYLTLCIKEGMRLHTPIPFVQRQTTAELEMEGSKIPAGTIIGVGLYDLHHNPAVWDDPMEFRPERFLPENMQDRDTYTYVPFSAGPRNCIGQNFAMNELKAVLARLLHRFTLELDSTHEVKKKLGVVMRAEDGIKVIAKLRNR